MAEFMIPKALKPGFKELLNLGDDDFNKVIELLDETSVGIGPNSFQDFFLEKTNHKFENSVLPQALFSFGSLLLRNTENEFSELARKLAASYDSEINKEDFEKLCSRLEIIFSKSINLKHTVKALELLGENDHVYSYSRIISDIRTIFNDDIENQNRRAVVIHNIRFDYKHNGQSKEFYISLDNADLNKLKRNIERALDKEDVIKNDYKGSFDFITIKD